MVQVLTASGDFVMVRVLLDPGSQLNFITRSIVNLLGAPVTKSSFLVTGINGVSTRYSESMQLTIKSCTTDFSSSVSVVVHPQFNQMHPSTPISIDDWRIPQELALADPTFNKPGPIQLLLNADISYRILESERYELGQHKPLLQNTKLGYVVVGNTQPVLQIPRKQQSFHVTSHSESYDLKEQFCAKGEIHTSILSREEKYCDTHLIEYHTPPLSRFVNPILVCVPTFQRELRAHSVSVRCYRLSIAPDVLKMYMQVPIYEDDRLFLLMLWHLPDQSRFSTLTLNTVTYILSSAPFTVMRFIMQVVDDAIEFKVRAECVLRKYCLDHMLAGGDTVHKVVQKFIEAKVMLSRASFKLMANISEISHSRFEVKRVDYITIGQKGVIWCSAKGCIQRLCGLSSVSVVKILTQPGWMNKLSWNDIRVYVAHESDNLSIDVLLTSESNMSTSIRPAGLGPRVV